MANWLVTTFRQASPSRAVAISFALAPVVAFALIQDWLGVYWLSIAASLGVLSLGLEALAAKARARTARIQEEWPAVIESLESGAQAGLSLLDSMRDLAESSQLLVARDFAWLCSECDGGLGLDEALMKLKARFSLTSCDLTIETIRLANELGGTGFIQALQMQAAALREHGQTLQQVIAKQGWVIGTAKVSVAAPWLIVAMLASRYENAQVYNSAIGQMLLALGMLTSFVAMRLISIIGRLQNSPRVFA
ncbi:MAG: hypothetical protein RL149_948 [Actinomycetota bacterium]